MSGEPVITLVGNLIADPELRFTSSGSTVAKFRIASTPRYLDRQTNEWKDGDTVFLEGLRCYGYHGVNPEERALGQRFVVDVALEADLRQAGETDDLAWTISYRAVAKRVRVIVEGPPRELIEAVAEAIATDLLMNFPPATAVTVTVRKPEAPIKGAFFDAAGVRIRRERTQESRP